MAASTREVFLLLRARDEASRVLRGFSSELRRSQEAMQAAAMRQEAIALQQEVTKRRQVVAEMAALAAAKQALALEKAKEIASARTRGVSETVLESMRLIERAHRREAAEINNLIRVMDKETSAMVAKIRHLDRQSSELERAHRQQRAFSQAITATAGSLNTVGIAFIGAGVAAGYFFVQTFRDFQEYQRQVALTQTQVDGFAASIEQVGEVGLRVANEIPVAFEQIQPALFDIFSSTSANLRQSEILLEGFAKAAVAGQTDVQTAARGTIAIMNGLNIPFERVNEVLDTQFELVRKGVGTYEEFAKVFGRIIPAANRAQQNFETVAAMLAFMTRNGQSAAMAATAAARALELFTHPGAVANLEKMNVKVRDVKGNYLPLIDILKQLRRELLKMPQADRVKAIVETFRGSGFNIQARRFLEQVVLGAGELEDFEALLISMGNAAGVMEEKYAQMADTAASKTQMLSNRWQIFKITVGEVAAPVIMRIIDLLSQMLHWFNDLDPSTKRLITNIALIATGFSFVMGTGLLLLGVLAGISAALVAAGGTFFMIIGIIAAIVTGFGAFTAAIVLAWQKSEPFRTLITNILDNIKSLKPHIKELGERWKKAFDEQVMPPLKELWRIINEEIIPAVDEFRKEIWEKAGPKIIETLRIIGDIGSFVLTNIAAIIEQFVIPTIKDLQKWWEENKETLDPLIDLLIEAAKWFAIIAAVIIAAGIITIIVMLVTIFSALAGAVVAVIEVFGLLRKLWNEIKNLGKAIWDSLKELWDKITGFFGSAGTFLYDQGVALIQGLVNGMKAGWDKLKGIVGNITQGIRDFFPSSPAKTGPLSGSGSPFHLGRNITSMLAAGMTQGVGMVQTASEQVANAVNPGGAFGGPGPFPPTNPGGPPSAPLIPANHRSVTVNVYTNEIDPRSTAAELGWELEGRL